MRFVSRLLCLLLALALPLSALGETTAAAASTVSQENPAPTVRVLLRRLGLTDRADLTLDGVYTAQLDSGVAMSFPKGSEVTVLVRSGMLYLFYEGMNMRAGTSLRLVRNASESASSEGIRFAKDGNFYPGDLSLSLAEGLLQPVCTLSVEDYLLGVVPYEMSNAFPLEALKAQAVCARTYALAHVKPDAVYDVVDTTNDQVFKGVNLTYENAVQAVKDTAGIVGTYKGNLASCYYSASNGGQTELVENVWSGRGDWGYYQAVDDPYDLENPESIVKRATLNKSGKDIPAAFTAVLANYMAAELTKQGFDPSAQGFRVDGISAMSLDKPKHNAPSRMYSELTLTFAWSGRSVLGYPQAENATAVSNAPLPTAQDEEISLFVAIEASPTPTPTATPAPSMIVSETPSATLAPTPEPTPIYSDWKSGGETTLTLPVFPEIIRALKLSISGSDNEMLTLNETEATFRLEARRYGHGVGMSQRGAQWMAGMYNKTFIEILSFYYPGMELKKVASGAVPLPTMEPDLAATPGPAATPTPRPTLMPVSAGVPQNAWMASVEGISDDSSLNLRAEPNMASDVLMRLYKHQQLVVLETCADPEWVKVKTDVAEGYVMISFLQKVE